jgi:hypothetical protein
VGRLLRRRRRGSDGGRKKKGEEGIAIAVVRRPPFNFQFLFDLRGPGNRKINIYAGEPLVGKLRVKAYPTVSFTALHLDIVIVGAFTRVAFSNGGSAREGWRSSWIRITGLK